MEKQTIIDLIRSTAEANGGTPLGRTRFSQETGVRESDWSGKYWASWNSAVEEAGFAPNALNPRLDDDLVLERLAECVRDLGRLPTRPELQLRRRTDASFPSHNTFNRFGPKREWAGSLLEYCKSREGFADIASICELAVERTADLSKVDSAPESGDEQLGSELGSVYMVKVGRHYKIGRSNSFGRREYELSLQLPEKPKTVHVIETDDPPGIEAYWHRRFADRRANGEWFELNAADLRAFKRRKFM